MSDKEYYVLTIIYVGEQEPIIYDIVSDLNISESNTFSFNFQGELYVVNWKYVKSIHLKQITSSSITDNSFTFDRNRMINNQTGKYMSLNGQSRKEKEIIAYLSHRDGMPDYEIAEKLGIGIASVPSYISRGKAAIMGGEKND